MNPTIRHALLTVTVIAALACSGAAVTIGFRTGWLTTNTTKHPVGRLRPADLTANLTPPPDLDATTTQPAASNVVVTTVVVTIPPGPHPTNSPVASTISTVPTSTVADNSRGLQTDVPTPHPTLTSPTSEPSRESDDHAADDHDADD